MDAFTFGGVSVRRAKLLKRPFRPPDCCEDRLNDLCFIKSISFDGYSFTSHGRETMRQALIMVTSDSMIVQIVAGMM